MNRFYLIVRARMRDDEILDHFGQAPPALGLTARIVDRIERPVVLRLLELTAPFQLPSGHEIQLLRAKLKTEGISTSKVRGLHEVPEPPSSTRRKANQIRPNAIAGARVAIAVLERSSVASDTGVFDGRLTRLTLAKRYGDRLAANPREPVPTLPSVLDLAVPWTVDLSEVDSAHGTHVASTAAAAGEHPGEAPAAEVVAYRVADEWELMKALEHFSSNPLAGVAVTAMGLDRLTQDEEDLCEAYIGAVTATGIPLVVAGGNVPDAGNLVVGPPASYAGAIAVGTFIDVKRVGGVLGDADPTDRVWDSSAHGRAGTRKPDVLDWNGGYVAAEPGGGYSAPIEGTSLASGNLAGLVASLLGRCDTERLAPAELRNVLQACCIELSDEDGKVYPENVQGMGALVKTNLGEINASNYHSPPVMRRTHRAK